MCGIAGFVGFAPIGRDRIDATLERMRNRGPDHRAFTQTTHNSLHITLLHSRLSIIDLDPRSNQPFERESAAMVFNGEIYNYVEQRAKLQSAGSQFSTASDTEVLLETWLRSGLKGFSELEGMWSFGIFDRSSGELVLSRDRFGEKPLYLYRTADGIFFGSEIKFLSALAGVGFTVNRRQVNTFLVYGYRELHKRGETFFAEVEEVPPATHVVISQDTTRGQPSLKLDFQRFWQPSYAPRPMTSAQAIEGIRHYLGESMRLRLRSDVPMAFCLSGGVDSGSLVSLATKVHQFPVSCYSIVDRDERYDESANINETVRDTGCELTTVYVTGEESLDRLRHLVAYHDAPVYTTSYYVHSFLMERVHQDHRKVVFSGTGSDELFSGYYDHFHYHLYDLRNDPEQFKRALQHWQQYILPVCRNPNLQDPQRFLANPGFRDNLRLDEGEFRQFLTEDFSEPFSEHDLSSSSLMRKRMLNEIGWETVPPILHEDDLNAMYYSIENRSPYLDSKLCEFAMQIPVGLLIENGYGKYLLREAMGGILNDTVRLTRQKKGFNADISSVFKLGDGDLRALILEDSPIFDYVERSKVESVLKLEKYPNSFSKFVFSLISTKLFLEYAQS